MGGLGSGTTGWKGKAEHHHSLDVNRLHRTGMLKPGTHGGWKWSIDGEKVASIRMRAEPGRLVLNYRTQPYGGDWQDVSYPVTLTHTDCALGGSRPWFICPGVTNGRWCARRVGKLYLAGRYFLCRHCLHLAYTCQSEDRHDRLMRRADKKRVRLGTLRGAANPIFRPKGMHWKTFKRIAEQIESDEAAGDMAFAMWILTRFPGLEKTELGI